jgi:hypothetical protein
VIFVAMVCSIEKAGVIEVKGGNSLSMPWPDIQMVTYGKKVLLN